MDSCEDVWAFWIRHGDVTQGSCEVGNSTGGYFESGDTRSQSTVRFNNSVSVYDFEFVVETLYSEVGNFRIYVECF